MFEIHISAVDGLDYPHIIESETGNIKSFEDAKKKAISFIKRRIHKYEFMLNDLEKANDPDEINP